VTIRPTIPEPYIGVILHLCAALVIGLAIINIIVLSDYCWAYIARRKHEDIHGDTHRTE
jgi:hypothetical protein